MAFYSCIILDGYKYKTLAKQWRPQTIRPASPRMTLSGELEAAFGPGSLKRWQGLVVTRHGESAPGPADGTLEGNIFTLRQTIQKRQAVSFTDHNGDTYQAVLTGTFEETALTNVWSSSANKYYVDLQITAKGEK